MKRTLIVVDMQKDFIDGALGTAEAQSIVSNVRKKIEAARAAGDEIIFTRDTHGENYLDTHEGKNLPVVHCVKGTPGWQISDQLETAGALCIDKPNFGWTRWNELELEQVELVGLCTDICVVSNALIIRAAFPDADITVDASCCAGVTPATHQSALDVMKMCQIKVINEA